MATVSGTAETYDLPQYVGELFLSGDEPRSLLRLIGVSSDEDLEDLQQGQLNNGRTILSNQFNLNVDYDLPSASQPSHAEGADASYSERDTSADQNVVQIHQEGIALSYSAQSNQETLSELGSTGETVMGDDGQQVDPGQLSFQASRKVEKIARDLNYSFVQGTFAQGSAGSARGTRGISNAVSTNVFDNSGTARNLTVSIFETALKDMIANGAFNVGARVVALCDADQYENLIDLYEPDSGSGLEQLAPRSATQAGVMIQTIRTKWGFVDVAYDADMPSGEIMILQPQFMEAVAREIREEGQRKGVLFLEPLAKTGSASKYQLYGEWGLDYGPEWKHGKIDDLNA